MIIALCENNNLDLQVLGFELAEKYLGMNTTLSKLSPEIFDVDTVRAFATKLPSISISDDAKHYWMKKLQGICTGHGQLKREKMIEHIFVQGLSDTPQSDGVFKLPADACKSAAIILTAIYEHFKNTHDADKETECVERLIASFNNCGANQAPSIMQENEILGLSPVPDTSTVEGFIEYYMVRFKQECAAKVIDQIDSMEDSSADAHQYSCVARVLNVLFNTGSTLTGYSEDRATIIEITQYSTIYVEYFTKENLINYFKDILNKPRNKSMREQVLSTLGIHPLPPVDITGRFAPLVSMIKPKVSSISTAYERAFSRRTNRFIERQINRILAGKDNVHASTEEKNMLSYALAIHLTGTASLPLITFKNVEHFLKVSNILK